MVGSKNISKEEHEKINKQDITHPIRVEGLENVPIVKVSASPLHVLALSQEGNVNVILYALNYDKLLKLWFRSIVGETLNMEL